MKNIGIYIHIPFCKSKCYYCDFNSYSNKESLLEKYIEAIKSEIEKYDLQNYKIKTIYIGGGTPSIINEKYIEEILKKIDISNAEEITIEVNPGTVEYNKLRRYYNIGINRLSIGLQATQNDLLREIGRIHTYEEFLCTYKTARKVGFKNINVDLMLGLPNQTLENLRQSVEKIVELKPEHISVYSLILEEGTELYNKAYKNEIMLIDENLERIMYWEVKQYLEKNKYNHYEISNFALNYSKIDDFNSNNGVTNIEGKLKVKDYKSIHNTDCWDQKEYIGIGAGASSFMNDMRYTNSYTIEEYIHNNRRKIEEVLNDKSKKQEFVILGLRKIEGINLQDFYKKFNVEFLEEFENEYKKLNNLGLIILENRNIKLTKKGIDLANLVWEEFI